MPLPLTRLLRRWRYGDEIVVVSGLPRSGTSMMMKMLEAGGLQVTTDGVREADLDNPKGYYELERVKNLEKETDKSWVVESRGKVLKVISHLLEELPDDCFYRVIFMRRDLEEVIASQNKMLDRRGEPRDETGDEKMIQLYRNHLRKVELILEQRPNFELLDVGYRQVIDEPREQAARVAKFLGLKIAPDQLASAVDRRLYRNRQQT